MALTDSGKKNVDDSTNNVQHDEVADGTNHGPKTVISEAAARGQGISGYEELSPWQTIMRFKVNSLVCFAVTFSAATDGYQIGYVSYGSGILNMLITSH